MKKILIYLVPVLLVLSSCDKYFPNDTVFEMQPFDEAACYTVDDGLVGAVSLSASEDPNFLDVKYVDALIADADGIQTVETKVTTQIVSGIKGTTEKTWVFAWAENYYDDVLIELYRNKTTDVIDSLLSGETYDGITFTDNFEGRIDATFDSVYTAGTVEEFTITEQLGKYEFFQEATRCLYGAAGSIPVLELAEKPFLVTCEAVEVMSLYSYLEIDTNAVALDNEILFYFNDYISMRIWDDEGNRIPMTDNKIGLEMAAEFGDRADESSGRVLSKCVYNLEPGKYFVRWVRAESTKSADQSETTSNYYKFRVGVFPASYEADPEIETILGKLTYPTITKVLRSPAQCDSLGVEQVDTLWAEDEELRVTDLLRSPDKMNALLNGLDSITVEDFNQGIHLSFDQSLPQGLFFLWIADSMDTDTGRALVEIDTLRMYINGGAFTMYKSTLDHPSGGKRFAPVTANVTGITFRENFVSTDIKDVLYFYNFDENLYIFSLNYNGEEDGINMVIIDS